MVFSFSALFHWFFMPSSIRLAFSLENYIHTLHIGLSLEEHFAGGFAF
jgi:hypothetical protein